MTNHHLVSILFYHWPNSKLLEISLALDRLHKHFQNRGLIWVPPALSFKVSESRLSGRWAEVCDLISGRTTRHGLVRHPGEEVEKVYEGMFLWAISPLALSGNLDLLRFD